MDTRTKTRQLTCNVVTLLLLVGGTTGCNQKPGTVTGTVAFLGQPVTSGSVVLYCADQQIVRGMIGLDGTYVISNVPRGEVRVTVVPAVRLPDGLRKRYSMPPVVNGPIMPDNGPVINDARHPAIPDRYRVPEESGLTLTVSCSETEFDIVLTR